MKFEAGRQWKHLRRRRQWLIGGAIVAFAAVVLAIFLVAYKSPRSVKPTPSRSTTATLPISRTVRLDLPPPDLLRPITPEEALAENAKREFSGRPDTPAAAFSLKTDPTSRQRALECLTQAVYYEAATEGQDGQRAVAQIVLNRMRHPAYPSTVCGVVYQGSERPIGCQFTFTCDGSLARMPVQSLWKQAQKIAEQALSGKVFAPVGHATHYHADYVLPFWADSLDKSVQIGRHIFYRLKDGLGASGAFRQRYGGVEPAPPPPTTVEVALEAVQNAGPQLAGQVESPLQVSAGELVASSQPKPKLVADSLQGTLIADGDQPPVVATRNKKPNNSQPCPAGPGNRIRAMTSNDLRSQSRPEDC
jgi:hypothetical protein